MIGPLLPPERGRWGGDNCRFLSDMWHDLKTGGPWQDMEGSKNPLGFGPPV